MYIPPDITHKIAIRSAIYTTLEQLLFLTQSVIGLIETPDDPFIQNFLASSIDTSGFPKRRLTALWTLTVHSNNVADPESAGSMGSS